MTGVPPVSHPWYTCPACGNQVGFRGPQALHRTGSPLSFVRGQKAGRAWWCDEYRLDLTCPCGHTWSLRRTMASDQPTSTYTPYSLLPPGIRLLRRLRRRSAPDLKSD
jgi:hypothetical protein